MKFSCAKFGCPNPQKIKFSASGFTSNQSAERAAKKAEIWLKIHSDDVLIYRTKAITVKAFWGLAYRTNSYIFYKDAPR